MPIDPKPSAPPTRKSAYSVDENEIDSLTEESLNDPSSEVTLKDLAEAVLKSQEIADEDEPVDQPLGSVFGESKKEDVPDSGSPFGSVLGAQEDPEVVSDDPEDGASEDSFDPQSDEADMEDAEEIVGEDLDEDNEEGEPEAHKEAIAKAADKAPKGPTGAPYKKSSGNKKFSFNFKRY